MNQFAVRGTQGTAEACRSIHNEELVVEVGAAGRRSSILSWRAGILAYQPRFQVNEEKPIPDLKHCADAQSASFRRKNFPVEF